MSPGLTALTTASLFYLLAVVPSGVEGIWCFQCNSKLDPECPDIKLNQTSSIHYKECAEHPKGYEVFCRKIVQKIHDRDGLIRVVRGCGWKKHPKTDCYKVSNVGHQDNVCQCFTDACNSSPWASSPPPSLMMLTAAYFTSRLALLSLQR